MSDFIWAVKMTDKDYSSNFSKIKYPNKKILLNSGEVRSSWAAIKKFVSSKLDLGLWLLCYHYHDQENVAPNANHSILVRIKEESIIKKTCESVI